MNCKLKSSTFPPRRVLAGQMEGHFISADAFSFTYAISGEEAAFAMDAAGAKELEVLGIEFSPEWSGIGIEGINLPS